MTGTNQKLEINFLDHVAIRVIDLNVSADWYEKVLGLKRHQPSEWGEYPILCFPISQELPCSQQLTVTSKSIQHPIMLKLITLHLM